MFRKYQIQNPPLYAGLSDIYRLMVLAEFGGMYLDFDAKVNYSKKHQCPIINRMISKPKTAHDGNMQILGTKEMAKEMLLLMEQGIKEDMGQQGIKESKRGLNIVRKDVLDDDPENINYILLVHSLKKRKYRGSYLRNNFGTILELTGPYSKAYTICDSIKPGGIDFNTDAPWRKERTSGYTTDDVTEGRINTHKLRRSNSCIS